MASLYKITPADNEYSLRILQDLLSLFNGWYADREDPEWFVRGRTLFDPELRKSSRDRESAVLRVLRTNPVFDLYVNLEHLTGNASLTERRQQ